MKNILISLVVLTTLLNESLLSQGWQFAGPDSVSWRYAGHVSGTWLSSNTYRLAATTGRGICLFSPAGRWSYDFINFFPNPGFPGMTYYYCEFSPWSADTFYVGFAETDLESYYRLVRLSFLGGIWQAVNNMGCWSTPFSVVHGPESSTMFASACGFLRSTDRGSTWTTLDSNGAMYMSKVLAVDNSSGGILYRAGRGSGIPNPNCLYRSTDQGTTWDSIFATPVGLVYNDYPQSVFAQRDSILVGIRSSDIDTSHTYGIFRSMDHGVTWTKVYSRGRVVGIVKSNVLANTLFAASEEGILRSVDFGATWAPYNNALPTTHLTSLLIGPFSDTMFVSTTTHGVLKVWNYLTGVTETHMLPGKIGLLQNYPNPFNPSTKIQFTIPEGTYGRTSLRVYDLLGREVATLVNEEMRPGTYERTLDAAGLASGIYFYRLQSGGFVETKKLAVVR